MNVRKLSLGCAHIFIVFSLFCSTMCLASVTGNVVDTNGNTVSGALVRFIDDSDPDNIVSSITDKDGTYSIVFTTDVENDKNTGFVPEGFNLEQNYPNPFNPSTVIPFSINKDGFIELSVFNILGQKVRTLIRSPYTAGRYSVIWNGFDDNNNSFFIHSITPLCFIL